MICFVGILTKIVKKMGKLKWTKKGLLNFYHAKIIKKTLIAFLIKSPVYYKFAFFFPPPNNPDR